MKYGRTILVTAVLLISLSLLNGAYGQPTQSSYTVKLTSFNLQVTCPSEVIPGDTVTVNVQGTPTGSGAYLQSLTATIYYANASNLHQLATENLVVSSSPNAYNNYISYGYAGSFSKSFTVNVPENASGTLVSLFSETVLPRYQGWTPYFPSYPYNPYSSSYPSFPTYPSYPSYPYSPSYPYYPYSSSYPSYVPPAYYPLSSSPYSYSSDQAIAPLSYIKTNTPETVTLQSENQMLQQQLNQTQGQSQQLQTKISQQNATINQLSQQLASVNGTIQTYQMLVLALGVLTVIVLAFSINQRRSKLKMQTVENKAST